MNTADFEKIEQELNVILPDQYKSFILDFPYSNYNFQSELAKDHTYNVFRLDSNLIISINNEMRKNGFRKKKWPNHFYIFGYDDDCYYFINLQDLSIYQAGKGITYKPDDPENMFYGEDFNEFLEAFEIVMTSL